MALARIKTWNVGETLTAADLNAEFNNPLNNPISLISPTTGAINFQTSVAHTNLQVSALTASSGFAGSVLITSTAGTPAPLWSTGATAGGVFVGTTAAIPTWSAASPLGGVFVSGTSGLPAWLSIGTSGQILTVATSGAAAWQAAPASGITVLDRVTADTTVANTTIETTIYTRSVAGGTLSTNVRLRLTLLGRISWAAADASSVTFRLKYGATTITAPVSPNTGGSPSNIGIRIIAELTGDGATNSQMGSLDAHMDNQAAGVTVAETSLIGQGTSAIDSTAAQNVVVTIQWGAGVTASETYTMMSAILEQL